MTLDLLAGSFAICRLEPDAPTPPWIAGAFTSVTRTALELSIVCDDGSVPAALAAERGYRGLAVRGPLDFSLVGIVADLSRVLAAAAISIFVVSTYDTDYVLIRDADIARAVAALGDAGHTVVSVV